MDYIVAIAVELDNGKERFYMSWGRIQDKVDPEPLEKLVLKHCVGDDLGGKPVKASMCWTLQEASSAPYFYEGLFSFSQQPIPFEGDYSAWSAEMNKRMQAGEELYFLGNPDRFKQRSRKST